MCPLYIYIYRYIYRSTGDNLWSRIYHLAARLEIHIDITDKNTYFLIVDDIYCSVVNQFALFVSLEGRNGLKDQIMHLKKQDNTVKCYKVKTNIFLEYYLSTIISHAVPSSYGIEHGLVYF